jgi:hypothetical protein
MLSARRRPRCIALTLGECDGDPAAEGHGRPSVIISITSGGGVGERTRAAEAAAAPAEEDQLDEFGPADLLPGM